MTQDPLAFGVLLIGIAMTLLGSDSLEERIHNRVRLAWHLRSIEVYRQWRTDSRRAIVRMVCWGLILLGVGSFTALIVGMWGAAGTLGLTALLIGLGYCISVIGYRAKSSASKSTIRNTLALQVARDIRTSVALHRLYGAFANVIFPIGFALILIAAIALIVNRGVSETINSAGVYCTETSPEYLTRVDDTAGPRTVQSAPGVGRFKTDAMCWASGLELEAGRRYVITLIMGPGTDSRWIDGHIPTDINGYPGNDFRHILGKPLTRVWSENWFVPIARIGRFGNDEYPLKSIEQIAPLPQPPDCTMGQDLSSREKATDEFAKYIDVCLPPASDRQVLRSEITARSAGQLFLYVNDAVVSVPGMSDYFFRNNSGSAVVRVDLITPSFLEKERQAGRQ